MKAIVWREIGKVELGERLSPATGESVIVKVGFAGICGSDLTIIAGKHPRAKSPLSLGHEFMGTVDSLPNNYHGPLTRGSRVAVNPSISCGICAPCLKGKEHICENLELLGIERDGGAFAEYVEVPMAERVFPLPDTVSDKEGALIEPIAVAVHAVEYAGIKPYESAVIFGAGPIGLLIAEVLKAFGVQKIIMCELDEGRLGRAERLGVQTVSTGGGDTVARILELTDGKGCDVVFEAAGVPATAEMAIPAAAVDGRIVMVAIHKQPAHILFRELAYRELKILGTRIYAADDFQKAIRLLAGKRIDAEQFISHVFGIDDALEAFEAARSGKDTCKILIKF